MSACPRCGSKGRTIEAATLEAQVLPDRLARLHEHVGWRLCGFEGCEVVYFLGDEQVVLGETRAVPFHKSEDPERLVCFCFAHTVAELEADVAVNGTSTLQASIQAACQAGREDCRLRNPQGRCCLGNVGQVVSVGDGARRAASSCCSS